MIAERRPRARRVVALAATLAAVVAVAVAVARSTVLGGDEGADPGAKPTATASVERQTLVERETVTGTLGYAGAEPLINRLEAGAPAGDDDDATGGNEPSQGGADGAGARPGGGDAKPDEDEGASNSSATVTALPRSGSLVRCGGTLYDLDNQPVVLMYGRVPAYRELRLGMSDGPDVRQLEANLAALGYGSAVTIDDHFSAATAAAVRRWQDSLGLEETGSVPLGRVVFLAGARRIGARKLSVGSSAPSGTEVLETTSPKRVVRVELDVAKQSLVRHGDPVVVTLPDGRSVKGRIRGISRVAREKADSGGGEPGGGEGGELVIDVTVVLRSRRGTSRLDEAPVSVDIARETKRGVLAVPVAALLARPGGGYGVEIVDATGSRDVAVDTGMFADGLVEISGRGIRAGMKVAVPEQ